jgi:hypothetical protein
MNLVRVALIVVLGGLAYFALVLYAATPTITPIVQKVETTCTWSNATGGVGAIIVAVLAIGGAIMVAGVDLYRRVY